ncbi:putative methyltransferase tdiE [Colletotrichum viniferum]|nr:putative methyltransferase tdiE [Colletotrichum viniferum]
MSAAAQRGTLAPLPENHRLGLIVLTAFSLLSFVSTTALWLFISYKLLSERLEERRRKRRRARRRNASAATAAAPQFPDLSLGLDAPCSGATGFERILELDRLAAEAQERPPDTNSQEADEDAEPQVRNPFPILVYNLLLADMMEALAYGLSCYWVAVDGIFAPSGFIGVDLSIVQAGFLPPNVTFEVDDIEEPWTFSDGFDYIHSRMMTGSISDWDKYLQKCYEGQNSEVRDIYSNLNPGGYLELNDIDAVPLADDGTLTEDTNLMKSVRLWHKGLAGLGRHFHEFSRFKDASAKVGFEDVHIKRYKWPTNGWSKDKKHKELGIWNLIAPHWDGFIMAPLTRALGWTKEDVLALGKDARRDFADRRIHAYFNIWSIYGRKPLA